VLLQSVRTVAALTAVCAAVPMLWRMYALTVVESALLFIEYLLLAACQHLHNKHCTVLSVLDACTVSSRPRHTLPAAALRCLHD
jgi:hypothetical protein